MRHGQSLGIHFLNYFKIFPKEYKLDTKPQIIGP